MKLSELIDNLITTQENFGDMEVVVNHESWVFNIESVYTQDHNSVCYIETAE